MYAWAVERLAASGEKDAVEKWIDQLYRPPSGFDPDRVSAEVIEDEMASFMNLRAVTGSG